MLVAIALVLLAAMVVAYAVSGRALVEKSLIQLATPAGLVWLGLTVISWALIQIKQRWLAILALLTWLVLTAGGNAFVSRALLEPLESPWRSVEGASIEPLDLIVLLGGGTSERSPGMAQLGNDGERVMTAAELFFAGKTEHILCTGSDSLPPIENSLPAREESHAILRGLNIPADRLHMLEGPNTSQEMQNLRTWLSENVTAEGQAFERVGIVTSAYHLSRAIRLAKANGVEAIGVPANFYTMPLGTDPSWVIPSGLNLRLSAIAVKEHLAKLVGR
jgi:uncharacterized SAM-binding protein YcdF (DUF218 family)